MLGALKEFSSKYQRSPFYSGASTHRWIWFYSHFIPHEVKSLDSQNASDFAQRGSITFKTEDYGEEVMLAYTSQQLFKRAPEYMNYQPITVWVGTWNAAGGSPSGSFSQ